MNTVIFTDTLSLILIIAIAALYALLICSRLFLPKVKIILTVGAALTLSAHLGLFAAVLLAKAPYEEILLLTVASAALALTVTRIGGEG